MCGVAGFVNLDGAPADTRAIGAMTSLLAHRGPDDRGEHLFSLRGGGAADSAFGFHRLSVLDLSGHGHQPMINPPGNIVLVYNGAPAISLEFLFTGPSDQGRAGGILPAMVGTMVSASSR